VNENVCTHDVVIGAISFVAGALIGKTRENILAGFFLFTGTLYVKCQFHGTSPYRLLASAFSFPHGGEQMYQKRWCLMRLVGERFYGVKEIAITAYCLGLSCCQE
jgi:hypothetical protein